MARTSWLVATRALSGRQHAGHSAATVVAVVRVLGIILATSKLERPRACLHFSQLPFYSRRSRVGCGVLGAIYECHHAAPVVWHHSSILATYITIIFSSRRSNYTWEQAGAH